MPVTTVTVASFISQTVSQHFMKLFYDFWCSAIEFVGVPKIYALTKERIKKNYTHSQNSTTGSTGVKLAAVVIFRQLVMFVTFGSDVDDSSPLASDVRLATNVELAHKSLASLSKATVHLQVHCIHFSNLQTYLILNVPNYVKTCVCQIGKLVHNSFSNFWMAMHYFNSTFRRIFI